MKYCYFTLIFAFLFLCNSVKAIGTNPHRIIVSSDIGGTDPDDFQSMVHLLLYADTFDIEGIISSPFGEGRAEHILEVIAEYEKDYPKLVSYSSKYPSPDSLRKLVKQGQTEIVSPVGYLDSTEGSNWIIECAKRNDPRPLHILVWGGIDDVAQALHDAPEILPKLRVYWIGGPNKKWSVNAYQYIADNFKNLWIIESNATYRGWFTGGNQSGEWGNSGFVNTYVKGHGALGDYFVSKKAEVKMGDTPSLMRLFNGNAEDPTQPSWGGQYVRAWERPHKVFNRITTSSDSLEEYGVLDLRLPFSDAVINPVATMNIDRPIEALVQNDTVRFLFSPKNASGWNYTIESNIPSLNNLSGQLTSYLTPASNKNYPSSDYPNWWVDDPSPEFIEDGQIGAKTLNKWREDFLTDFAARMYRCAYYPNTYFKLNTTVINGSITKSLEDTAYKAGSKVTLTAIANEGYKFLKWEGDVESTDSIFTITMNSDKNITATFTPITSINKQYDYKILIYPTFIQDYVTISFLNQPSNEKVIKIFNVSGKLLSSHTIDSEQNSLIIDTCMLNSGFFIVRISYGVNVLCKTIVKV